MRSVAVAVIAVLGLGLETAVLTGCDAGGTKKSAKASTKLRVLRPAPFKPGMPFAEPPSVHSRHGKLRATLVARDGVVSVSGVEVADTQTYAVDGAGKRGFLGPTLHANPGDEVEMTLDNRLTVPPGAQPPNCGEPGGHMEAAHVAHGTQGKVGDPQLTNLHFHGLHVTPREQTPYGDTVLVHLENGKWRFRFRIPKSHDRGTFWYHAHLHGCTDDEVSRGLAGLLLIGDSRRDLPRRFRKIATRALALKDVQVARSGRAPGWRIAPGHTWLKPTHRTVNGLVNPRMTIRPGETQMWRLANVSAGVWYRTALVDPANDGARDPLTVVAQDGNSLDRPVQRSSLLIPPGARFDVLVRGPASGSRVLETLPFDQGAATFPKDPLATLDVTGARAPDIAPPRRLTPPTQGFPKAHGPTRRMVFDIDLRTSESEIPKKPKSFIFSINSHEFDQASPEATPTLGTTERWVLYNKSSEWHPFHIHQDDFRVVETSAGGPPELPGEHDTVALPPGTPVKPSRTVIEMPFTDYAGRFVFHCHILDHEDAGMMALVDLRRRSGRR